MAERNRQSSSQSKDDDPDREQLPSSSFDESGSSEELNFSMYRNVPEDILSTTSSNQSEAGHDWEEDFLQGLLATYTDPSPSQESNIWNPYRGCKTSSISPPQDDDPEWEQHLSIVPLVNTADPQPGPSRVRNVRHIHEDTRIFSSISPNQSADIPNWEQDISIIPLVNVADPQPGPSQRNIGTRRYEDCKISRTGPHQGAAEQHLSIVPLVNRADPQPGPSQVRNIKKRRKDRKISSNQSEDVSTWNQDISIIPLADTTDPQPGPRWVRDNRWQPEISLIPLTNTTKVEPGTTNTHNIENRYTDCVNRLKNLEDRYGVLMDVVDGKYINIDNCVFPDSLRRSVVLQNTGRRLRSELERERDLTMRYLQFEMFSLCSSILEEDPEPPTVGGETEMENVVPGVPGTSRGNSDTEEIEEPETKRRKLDKEHQ